MVYVAIGNQLTGRAVGRICCKHCQYCQHKRNQLHAFLCAAWPRCPGTVTVLRFACRCLWQSKAWRQIMKSCLMLCAATSQSASHRHATTCTASLGKTWLAPCRLHSPAPLCLHHSLSQCLSRNCHQASGQLTVILMETSSCQ